VIKVLVVDDHPLFRRGLVSVLEEYPDFQVMEQANNGVEAVAKAKELQPDIVVMDLCMPGGDGVEATLALQQTLPLVKVLILTVSEKDDDLFAAIEAGARGYLLKDANVDELTAAIRTVAAGDVIISPAMATRLVDELRQGNEHKADDELGELTLRESEVLQLVAQGASNKEIALELFISQSTVKAHLRAILEKLHVKNRAQAVARATAKGWLKSNHPPQ
jgi:DNA-binding NarL/FixJ family response regulator